MSLRVLLLPFIDIFLLYICMIVFEKQSKLSGVFNL